MWLAAGNRYLQCDGVREVGLLNKDGGLTVGGWVGGYCIKCLKRGWNGKKKVGKQIFKKEETCWVK